MEKFSALKYVRPDFKTLTKEVKRSVKEMKKAKNYEEFIAGFHIGENVFIEDFTTKQLCSIRNNINMADEFYDSERKYLSSKSTGLQLAFISFYKALINSPFRKDFEKENGNFLTTKIENTLKLTNLFSLLDEIKENNLSQQYSKKTALCETDFRGEKCNFYGLLKHMESTDRAERKEAFEAWSRLYQSVADDLDKTYDKLIKIRLKKAKHLGFKNYIDYIYLARERYDYKAPEAKQFRESVKEIIVPLCSKLYEKQKARIGVDKLHFYDEKLVYPHGNATPIGTMEELVAKAGKMYDEMSEQTSEYFRFMSENELYDLQTRPGKHMGGYCTFLPKYKAPFIFSNFNGTSADVDVLTHEAGHAFECYTASRALKCMMNTASTSEINEIHSMSMETFAYPWMNLFFGDKTNQYLFAHLSDSLIAIPYLCCVDDFQHKVFENPSMSAMQRRKVWHQLEQEYLPWRDYDGDPFLSEGGFWMQKQHIFLYPFYYIDYALAQICAYQFALQGFKDPKGAFERYYKLCQLGGSMGYFDLLKAVDLKSPFVKENVKEVIEAIYQKIEELEKNI